MATVVDFLHGARPRTLPAAVVPVIVGIAVAADEAKVNVLNALLALVVALAVQIGTNYANDYSDGVKGTDSVRVGPTRLVAGAIASPRAVKIAALVSFFVTAAAGLTIAVRTSPWLILVGALCILAGWLYTGGPKPYGYLGLGELFVFIFFGLVAVIGTTYAASDKFIPLSVFAAVPVGLLAVCLLMINNIRDIETDKKSGKNTLAVIMGDKRSRLLYVSILVSAVCIAAVIAVVKISALLVLLCIPLMFTPVRKVLAGDKGLDLIPVLAKTALVQIVAGILLAIGIWL